MFNSRLALAASRDRAYGLMQARRTQRQQAAIERQLEQQRAHIALLERALGLGGNTDGGTPAPASPSPRQYSYGPVEQTETAPIWKYAGHTQGGYTTITPVGDPYTIPRPDTIEAAMGEVFVIGLEDKPTYGGHHHGYCDPGRPDDLFTPRTRQQREDSMRRALTAYAEARNIPTDLVEAVM